MSYVKQIWKNLPDQTTPLSADRLNHLETQYEEASSDISQLEGYLNSELEDVRDYVDTEVGGSLTESKEYTDTEISNLDVSPLDLVAELSLPAVVAHRGSANVFPDSSITGFRKSFEGGFSLELDVWKLSDDSLAVWHDSTTGSRVSGSNVPISTLSREDWLSRKVLPEKKGNVYSSALEKTCTLDQLLDEFGGRVVLWPEIKDPSATQPLIDAVVSRRLQKSVIVQTVSWSIVQQLLAEGIYVMYRNPEKTPQECKDAGVSFIGLPASQSGNISNYTSVGLEVAIFTNSVSVKDNILSLGAGAVISDDPWLMTQNLGYGTALKFNGNKTPMMSSANSPGSTVQVYIQGDQLLMDQNTGPNGFNSVTLGGLGVGGPEVKVGLTVNGLTAKNDPPTESTLIFGLYLGKRQDGGAILPGDYSNESYRGVVVRRDGRMQMYDKKGYSAGETNLGGSPKENISEAGKPSGDIEFEISFSNTSITIEDRTNGFSHTETHPTWSGETGLYLTLHTRGGKSIIKNIWSQGII